MRLRYASFPGFREREPGNEASHAPGLTLTWWILLIVYVHQQTHSKPGSKTAHRQPFRCWFTNAHMSRDYHAAKDN